MADGTKIEWTDATWNPIRARRTMPDGSVRIGWHCEHASPGCVNCYAETMNKAGRSAFTGTRLPYKPGHRGDVEIFLDEKVLLQPLRWRAPRRIFPCSMTDLFGAFVTDEMLDRIFAVMALCPQHIFQPLTKRADRMRAYVTAQATGSRHVTDHVDEWQSKGLIKPVIRDWIGQPDRPRPLPNVWLGVSVEDQKRADERIPDLHATPAAVRFLSCEPLLGRVDICEHLDIWWNSTTDTWIRERPSRLHWVIAGGESGPKARPMHPDWARSLRDQCAAAGVPFFFKQWGEWLPEGQASGGGLQEAAHPMGSGGPLPGARGWRVVGEQGFSSIGKKAAGRLLDGVEHSGMPVLSGAAAERTAGQGPEVARG